jgi:hypothetical protein
LIHSAPEGKILMCFSATASFSVAAATAMVGIGTLRHANSWQQLPLAVVPLLFAFQQTIEGILWLQLSGGGNAAFVPALSLIYLVFAEGLWPAYAATAALLVEPDPRRQTVMSILAAFGFAISAYLMSELIETPQAAFVRGNSIAYSSTSSPLSWQQLPYLICTCLPPLLSSHKVVRLFGLMMFVGFLMSAYMYSVTFVSVWCFFAAAGSILLYFCFKRDALRVASEAWQR